MEDREADGQARHASEWGEPKEQIEPATREKVGRRIERYECVGEHPGEHKAQGWMEDSQALGDLSPEANQTVRFVPMKRAGDSDEVAPLAVYLASDASGYVTGQVMFVDGGLTVHL